MTLIAIAILIVASLTFMISRSNKQHLKKAERTEEPWVLDTGSTPNELSPCDPTNAKRGNSLAWLESNSDLAIKNGAVSDENWTLSGADLKPNI
tara:strand:+ start:121 stop:402 length:282 start_codon:yes stop_codon:yes gene_type:complete